MHVAARDGYANIIKVQQLEFVCCGSRYASGGFVLFLFFVAVATSDASAVVCRSSWGMAPTCTR